MLHPNVRLKFLKKVVIMHRSNPDFDTTPLPPGKTRAFEVFQILAPSGKNGVHLPYTARRNFLSNAPPNINI